MNMDETKGNIKEFNGKVKQQWGKLTDDDITRANGKAEELAGMVQKAYGKTKEQAAKEVADFHKSCGCSSLDKSVSDSKTATVKPSGNKAA